MTESGAAAAADAYFECMIRLAALTPGGFARVGEHGARLVFTTLPVSLLRL